MLMRKALKAFMKVFRKKLVAYRNIGDCHTKVRSKAESNTVRRFGIEMSYKVGEPFLEFCADSNSFIANKYFRQPAIVCCQANHMLLTPVSIMADYGWW